MHPVRLKLAPEIKFKKTGATEIFTDYFEFALRGT